MIVMPTICKPYIEYKKNTEELEKDKDWFYERFANNYTAEIYKRKHEDVYRF